jgi:hypothetical protein
VDVWACGCWLACMTCVGGWVGGWGTDSRSQMGKAQHKTLEVAGWAGAWARGLSVHVGGGWQGRCERCSSQRGYVPACRVLTPWTCVLLLLVWMYISSTCVPWLPTNIFVYLLACVLSGAFAAQQAAAAPAAAAVAFLSRPCRPRRIL